MSGAAFGSGLIKITYSNTCKVPFSLICKNAIPSEEVERSEL